MKKKLYYSIHNSIRICKRVVVAAYHVVLWSSGYLCVVRRHFSDCVPLAPKVLCSFNVASWHGSLVNKMVDSTCSRLRFLTVHCFTMRHFVSDYICFRFSDCPYHSASTLLSVLVRNMRTCAVWACFIPPVRL